MAAGFYYRNAFSVLREEGITFRSNCVAPEDRFGFVPARLREIDVFDFQRTSYTLRIVRVQRIESLDDGLDLRKRTRSYCIFAANGKVPTNMRPQVQFAPARVLWHRALQGLRFGIWLSACGLCWRAIHSGSR